MLTIAVTTAVGLGGLFATRKWVRRVHRDRHSHNEVVGYYLGAVCVFYGITLGLLAVATWQTYSDLEARVGEEAAAVGALYRDVSSFPDPNRTELQSDLRRYAPSRFRICVDLGPVPGSTDSREPPSAPSAIPIIPVPAPPAGVSSTNGTPR